ncbi:carotenoid oxygenase family protein [Laspinema olomoucense]|uniref:carotenoid oxygenase family protein n=1 Tax=Laspinema olomoucense TaxID=3231600 RepID=UPI00295001EF|nr:carotenoid oxygenase family protein [Laspinema sp. D3d]
MLNLLEPFKITGKSILQFLRACIGIFTDNFLYLVRWDGSGDLQKWQVLHQGFPLKIKQSTHQMGLTENYLVLIDTAFKISVEEILPTRPNKKSAQLEKWLRNIFDHPQLKDNTVYIIDRRELLTGKKSVQAKKVTIPREAAHFLVDYRNPDDQITLHLAHVCAWDAAEWVTKFDDASPLDKTGTSPLYGAIAGPMDISKLGCHVINGKTGQFIRENQDILMDKDYTWGAAIYAYRERPFPDRLEDIYWSCLGCWADLKTPHIEHLYNHYPYREVGLEELDEITTQGKPSTLFRLHIAPLDQVAEDENRLSIADGYQFPEGHWVVSPQFIPRPGTEGSTDGYILCVVHSDESAEPQKTNGNELWIFDAADLKSGPQYKLWHEQFNVGFTIHTAWLPQIKKRNASYCIEMRDDYADILNQQSLENKALIQDLFENWVYPKKEPGTEQNR